MKKVSTVKLESQKLNEDKYISLNGEKLNEEMARILGGSDEESLSDVDSAASTDRLCGRGCGPTARW